MSTHSILQHADQVKTIIEQRYDTVFETFQALNKHPELMFELPHTVRILKAALAEVESMRLVDVEGAPCCFVGIMENGEGPTIVYRTDEDALPITDLTDNPWKSEIAGRAHCCSHSTHMSVALMVCHIMSAMRPYWKGRFMLYAQSAEEGGTPELGSGAQCMLREGLYQKFGTPDAILAIHCDPFRPAGALRLKKGIAFAHTSMFDLNVWGEAAHGGMPFKGIDTILLAARCVDALQSIVSRELNPKSEPAVVTVGAFHAGQAPNAVPAEARLKGTIRCFSEASYLKIRAAMKRTVEGQAMAMGVPPEKWPQLVFHPVFAPQLHNDEALGDRLEALYRRLLPDERQVEIAELPEFYGEDFANYALTPEKVKVFLTWVGSVDPALFNPDGTPRVELPSLHDGRYTAYWNKQAPTDTLRTGALTQACGLLELLGD